MSCRARPGGSQQKDGGAGFRIGIRSDINEYRSNSFADGGINAGLLDGQLVLGQKTARLDKPADLKDVRIVLTGALPATRSSLRCPPKPPMRKPRNRHANRSRTECSGERGRGEQL